MPDEVAERPEDRFDAAAARFRGAATKAKDACRALASGATAPTIRAEVAAAPGAPASSRESSIESAVEPVAPVVATPPVTAIPAELFAPPPAAAPAPASPRPSPIAARRPPAAALVDEMSTPDLSRFALEPLDGRLRWQVPLSENKVIEVAAGPEDADVGTARHWSEGFGDLYEPIADLGEAAVWEPMSHTLHTHERGWAVMATVDVTFGSELARRDLARITDVARAALAARPETLPSPPPPRQTGRLRRSRRG